MPSRKRTSETSPAEDSAHKPASEALADAAEEAGALMRKRPRAPSKTASAKTASAKKSSKSPVPEAGVAGELAVEAPETRAHDLIPALAPVQAPPRKVALRRVVGHGLGERLLSRRGFRPAGNSRRFWRRVEAEDPFLANPEARSHSRAWEDESATLQPAMAREPAAAQRLGRVEGGAEPAAKAPARSPTSSRPSPQAPKPAPQPREAKSREAPAQEAAPKRAPAPTPTHTPEPRPVPPPQRPTPQRPEASSEARPAPRAAAGAEGAPAIDRRPKIVPHQPAVRPGGRVAATPSNVVPRPQLVDKDGRSPDEVRREAEAARRGPPPPPRARSLDEILGILGDLQASERLYHQGLLKKDAEAEAEAAPRPASAPKQPQPAPQRPAPQKPAPKPSPSAAARARPAGDVPAPDEPDLEEEEPPRKATSSPPAPIDRSPTRAAAGPNGASLDDLFGGGDTRLKIGKRTLRKQPEPDASSDDS